MMSVPPRSDLAWPIAETVTSSRWPGLAIGGNSAVTITAAALRVAGLSPGGSERPKRLVTPRMASVAYCRLSSPVPGRPTTMP